MVVNMILGGNGTKKPTNAAPASGSWGGGGKEKLLLLLLLFEWEGLQHDVKPHPSTAGPQ